MTRLVLIASLAVVAVGACAGKGEGDEPDPSSAPRPHPAPPASGTDATAKARQVFASRCQMCHGPEGRGDGPMANSLNPRPRDFHDEAFQAAATDEHIVAIIRGGGATVGKSASMPGNTDLSDEVVVALKDLVRGLGK